MLPNISERLLVFAGWPHADEPPVSIWEIVAELISLCVTNPTPENPFEMEFGTLEGPWAGPPADDQGGGDEAGAAAAAGGADLELTDLERALNYGAVAGLLHEMFLSNAPYAPLVAEDMKRCTERHFKGMGALLHANAAS